MKLTLAALAVIVHRLPPFADATLAQPPQPDAREALLQQMAKTAHLPP
jgi:hypothetical protein